MFDHISQRPEEWNISRKEASFPKEGSKQILISYNDAKNSWEYILTSQGDGFRRMNGFYAAKIGGAIDKQHSKNEQKALMRALHPELDGVLLLK